MCRRGCAVVWGLLLHAPGLDALEPQPGQTFGAGEVRSFAGCVVIGDLGKRGLEPLDACQDLLLPRDVFPEIRGQQLAHHLWSRWPRRAVMSDVGAHMIRSTGSWDSLIGCVGCSTGCSGAFFRAQSISSSILS